MRRIIGILLLLVISASLKAQKPIFTNQSNFGFLLGEQTKGVFTAQNFSGIAFKKYNTDLGIVLGYDNYHFIKIIPLAFAARYNLKPINKITPYLMISSGYGFGFNKKTENTQTSYKGGFMFNPNIGLKFNNTGKIGYHFTVGYKTQKSVIIDSSSPIYSNFFRGGSPSTTSNTDSYLLRKVVLTLGLSI